MPKKTPRGGRYTKGIKSDGKGHYAGQTYGRRGCSGIILAVIAIIGIGLAVLCG